jgi:hypothetical protein
VAEIRIKEKYGEYYINKILQGKITIEDPGEIMIIGHKEETVMKWRKIIT